MSKSYTRACVAVCLMNLVNLNLKHEDVFGAAGMGFLFLVVMALEVLRWVKHRRKDKTDEHDR